MSEFNIDDFLADDIEELEDEASKNEDSNTIIGENKELGIDLLFSQSRYTKDKDYTEIPSKAIRLFNTSRKMGLGQNFTIARQDIYVYLLRGKGKKTRRLVYKRGNEKTEWFYDANRRIDTVVKNTGYSKTTVGDTLTWLQASGLIDTGRGMAWTCTNGDIITKLKEPWEDDNRINSNWKSPRKRVIEIYDIEDCNECEYYVRINNFKQYSGNKNYECPYLKRVNKHKNKIDLPDSRPFTRIWNPYLDFLLAIKSLPARNLLWYLMVAELKSNHGNHGISLSLIAREYHYGVSWLSLISNIYVEGGLLIKMDRGDGRRNYADSITFNHAQFCEVLKRKTEFPMVNKISNLYKDKLSDKNRYVASDNT